MAQKERYGKEADKIWSSLISGDASIKADVISYGNAHPGTISWEEVRELTNNIAASKTPKEYLANKAALWEALKPVYSGALLANQDNEVFRDEIKKQYSQFEAEAPSNKLGSHVTLRDLSQDPVVVKYLGRSDEKNANFIQDNRVWKDGQFVKQEGSPKKATADLNNLTDEQIHYLAQEVYGVEDNEFKQAIADKWAKQQKANKIWNDFQADKETARQRDEYAKKMNSGFGGIAGNAVLPTTFEAYTEAVQKGEDVKNLPGTIATDAVSNVASLAVPVGLGGKVVKTAVNPYGKALVQNAVTGLADAGIEVGRQVAASSLVDSHEFDGAGALATGIASATVPAVLKSGLSFGEQLGFETGKIQKALKGANIDPADIEKWRIRLNADRYVNADRSGYHSDVARQRMIKNVEDFWNDQMTLGHTPLFYENAPEFRSPKDYRMYQDMRRVSGKAKEKYIAKHGEENYNIGRLQNLGNQIGSDLPPDGSTRAFHNMTDANLGKLKDLDAKAGKLRKQSEDHELGYDVPRLTTKDRSDLARSTAFQSRFPGLAQQVAGITDSKLAQLGNGLVGAVPRFDVLGSRSGNGLGGSWVGGALTLQGTDNSAFNAGEKQEKKIAKTRKDISDNKLAKLTALYNEAMSGSNPNYYLADIYRKQLEELAKK